MRDHIRREASQFLEATWWLVPVAFATAALAAVAFIEPAVPETTPQMVAPTPEITAPAVVPVALPQPAQVEVAEHVQAF